MRLMRVTPKDPAALTAEQVTDLSGPPIEIGGFGSFFAAEYSRLVALAYALTGSRATAEDVAQDAMVSAYQNWSRISRMDHPAAYVRRACANLAVSSVRRRIAEGKALLRLASRPEPVGLLEPVDEEFWAAVRRLPTRQAQVVALHYGSDLAVADVARAMGVTEGSVKQHLSRARAALAKELGDEQGAGS